MAQQADTDGVRTLALWRHGDVTAVPPGAVRNSRGPGSVGP